ncbi:primosomal protein N' [Nonomuraea sp. NPDC050536]|uniref:primosomal protein N' n=1 Tax=Nonomuraea sp. NPDC050536 TaxID=3364366 RepID=UPI0037CC9E32
MPESDDALLPLSAVRPASGEPVGKGAPVPAEERPVARVAVENPLPHLDRAFDYLVPASMDAAAQPGVRVRVRFAGKLVDGFLLERVEESEHAGRLAALERVVSPERVLTPEIATLARAVADRYAGTLADVLRLAIPPRHAKTEAEPTPPPPTTDTPSLTTDLAEPMGGSAEQAGGGAVAADLAVGSEGPIGSSGEGVGSSEGRSEGVAEPTGGSGEQAGDGAESAVPHEGPIGSSEGRTEGEQSAGAVVVAVLAMTAEEPAKGTVAPAESPAEPSRGESAREGGEGLGGVGRAWGEYPNGGSFLEALEQGRQPRAVWSALPGARGWAAPVAEAVRATLAGGRGAVVVVPDGKDVALADAEFARALGPGRHVALTADLGPAERYRRWLRVLRGQARAVVGTRAAAFAPVADLGLVAIWDDGDDLHAERLAPYPHAREVLALRAHLAGAGMLVGGYARTAEATQLIATGWARPLVAARQAIRAAAPRVKPAGEDAELAKDQAARAARLPSVAWRALRLGLESGPVLVQVPRRGYLPALACQHCRAPTRCIQPPTRTALPPDQLQTEDGLCHGPLALRSGHAVPYCRWCGRIAAYWRCENCGSPRLRAMVVGARRTAEELGRAFPSVNVRTSGRDGVLATVSDAKALVVATPGAEPVAEGGYAAAVLLDGWALLGRADLRAAEETVRRWMNAAALLRPAAELVVLADATLPAVQALLRWDPITHAERELADRAELGFPPAVRMATLTGAASAVRQMLDELRLPPAAQVLGPVPVDESGQERAMIRVARGGGAVLSSALKGASGVRAARKTPDVVKVSVDPLDLI